MGQTSELVQEIKRETEGQEKRTIDSLALRQVRVLCLSQETGFEASHDTFKVPRVRVEEEGLHVCWREGRRRKEGLWGRYRRTKIERQLRLNARTTAQLHCIPQCCSCKGNPERCVPLASRSPSTRGLGPVSSLWLCLYVL